jgi:tRNA 5-methylaminomethyl-2-thiouridine biosynthesis bifunctional protein
MAAAGSGAPHTWAGRNQWSILCAGGDAGRDVLHPWDAWKRDALRPRLLHLVAILESAAAAAFAEPETSPALSPLREQLRAQCIALTPGMHRLAFEHDRVLLTLCVGPVPETLRELAFQADEIRFTRGAFDALAADGHTSAWKSLLPVCRIGTRIRVHPGPTTGSDDLQPRGFVPDGATSDASALHVRYAPAWRTRQDMAPKPVDTAECVVIGGGLAGAAAAASLARRGWKVQVLDAAPLPAAGASALPAGLLAPHQSPDDNLLSRLSRAGARITLSQCAALLRPGEDWSMTGVLERRGDDARPPPPLGDALLPWTRTATPGDWAHAGEEHAGAAWWHALAAWIRPAALVRAWLAQDGISFLGGTTVTGLRPTPTGWQVLDAQDRCIATTPLVVIAAANGSAGLCANAIGTHAVRGQVSWGAVPPGLSGESAINGDGHFIPRVPLDGQAVWLTGSTYGRGDDDGSPRASDHAENLQRLRRLAPAAASAVAPLFERSEVHAWAGVRCASHDRRPLVGEIAPGCWVSTAMGSRGLTFAALCGELIAARLHGEPLPLEARLARALDAIREAGAGASRRS